MPSPMDLVLDAPALRAARDRVTRSVLADGRDSVAEATRGLEQEIEALTKGAVKGRLWRAWKSSVFPGKGRIAREPVGTIFVNGGNRSTGAISFFTTKGRITGKSNQWLAIPTQAAGSRGRARDLTPAKWEAAHGVKLRLIFRPGKPGLLVADGGTTSGKSGRFRTIRRKASAAEAAAGVQRGQQTVVIFTLVPFVPFRNSVAIDPAINRAPQKLADAFVRRRREAGEA